MGTTIAAGGAGGGRWDVIRAVNELLALLANVSLTVTEEPREPSWCVYKPTQNINDAR